MTDRYDSAQRVGPRPRGSEEMFQYEMDDMDTSPGSSLDARRRLAHMSLASTASDMSRLSDDLPVDGARVGPHPAATATAASGPSTPRNSRGPVYPVYPANSYFYHDHVTTRHARDANRLSTRSDTASVLSDASFNSSSSYSMRAGPNPVRYTSPGPWGLYAFQSHALHGVQEQDQPVPASLAPGGHAAGVDAYGLSGDHSAASLRTVPSVLKPSHGQSSSGGSDGPDSSDSPDTGLPTEARPVRYPMATRVQDLPPSVQELQEQPALPVPRVPLGPVYEMPTDTPEMPADTPDTPGTPDTPDTPDAPDTPTVAPDTPVITHTQSETALRDSSEDRYGDPAMAFPMLGLHADSAPATQPFPPPESPESYDVLRLRPAVGGASTRRHSADVGRAASASANVDRAERDDRDKFIAIGIDFGTTYSSVSWAYSGDGDGDGVDESKIANIQNYGSCMDPATAANRGRDEAQVPTVLGKTPGTWGYGVGDDDADPLRWFKLLLLREADVPAAVADLPHMRKARSHVRDLPADAPVKMAAEFLGHLWERTLAEIRVSMDRTMLDSLPLRVALTVPAMWPDYAKQAMRQAAHRAGITAARDAGPTELMLVQEPEAAALATLMALPGFRDMPVGRTFVVVDCGGGTVDVISYKVVGRRPFRVREVVGGAGDLCGAFLVDEHFARHVRALPQYNFDKCPPAVWRAFVAQRWEQEVKRNFAYGPGQPTSFSLTPPVKALKLIHLVRHSRASEAVQLSYADVESFFAPTYAGIRRLVDSQYRQIQRADDGRKPDHIILVGGFGSSRYVLGRLQDEFESVLHPKDSWSVVARGAVVAALQRRPMGRDTGAPGRARVSASPPRRSLDTPLPAVVTRIARLSYGVVAGVSLDQAARMGVPYDAALDTMYTVGGAPRVNRLKWFVCRGDTLDNREPVSYRFWEWVPSRRRAETTFRIWVSTEDPPPVRYDSRSCVLLCTLHCRYDVPFDAMKRVPGDGDKSDRRVVEDMRLTMAFGAQPVWRLKVGKRDLVQNVNVDYSE